MLVNEYFESEIADKPYRYQTKLNMVRCLRKLELWDMEYEPLIPQFVGNILMGSSIRMSKGLMRAM